MLYYSHKVERLNREVERMNYKIKEVHISTIKVADTVLHDGHLKTVCRNNLGKSDFMGLTLFGDSYHSGYKKVKKVIFLCEGKEV